MSLPDDVLLEIFPRVKDVVALFRCATSCKGWCRLLVSDPAYLRRCLPEDTCRSSPFAGILTQQPRRRRHGNPVPCFVPGPRPVLGPRVVLSSMVPGMGHQAVPLTSRHGLLLVRVGDLLIMCNPLAGTFRSIPRLDNLNHRRWDSPHCLTGYAILTAADCSISEDWPLFKVMIIDMAIDPMHYSLYTYSSVGELGWSTRSGTNKDDGRDIHVELLQDKAVVCGGAAHWFFRGTLGFYILTVSADTGHISTSKAVDTRLCDLLGDSNYDVPYLSVDAEGRLAFLCLTTDGTRVDIWTFNNDETDSHIMLQPPPHKIHCLIEHTCLGEKNGKLIIKDDRQRIYIADMKTGVMREITDCPRNHGLSPREIVPLEIDWTALFISQLGVIGSSA